MPVQVKTPTELQKYVRPDGRLTIEGLQLLLSVVQALRDHETRITALEP